ncbi:MAG TPA: hypothetical protein VGS22_03785 [Thermoanaerobaculia bacterium]|jgi:hypothetical protein|nr:hypothetical protein [Thermoanaerobaculia bacterium]
MDKWQDEIVAEIRAVREAYAQRFNYDAQAICRDLRRLQEESGRKVVRPTQDQAA